MSSRSVQVATSPAAMAQVASLLAPKGSQKLCETVQNSGCVAWPRGLSQVYGPSFEAENGAMNLSAAGSCAVCPCEDESFDLSHDSAGSVLAHGWPGTYHCIS